MRRGLIWDLLEGSAPLLFISQPLLLPHLDFYFTRIHMGQLWPPAPVSREFRQEAVRLLRALGRGGEAALLPLLPGLRPTRHHFWDLGRGPGTLLVLWVPQGRGQGGTGARPASIGGWGTVALSGWCHRGDSHPLTPPQSLLCGVMEVRGRVTSS